MVKQISDNEIYLLIKYIKSVLWRVAKRLSYTEDVRCLKVKHLKKLSLNNMEEIQYVSHMPDICKCCGIIHQKHAGTDVIIMKQYATVAVLKFWGLSIYTVVFKAMTSCSHGYPQLLLPSSRQKALLFKDRRHFYSNT